MIVGRRVAGESKVREGKQIGRVGTREGGGLGGRVGEERVTNWWHWQRDRDVGGCDGVKERLRHGCC